MMRFAASAAADLGVVRPPSTAAFCGRGLEIAAGLFVMMFASVQPVIEPSAWMMLPFIILLATIALAPLFFGDWWGRHYGKVAFSLAIVSLSYYLFSLRAYDRVLNTAEEYLSFICLIGSLFVVSGGIHINVKGEATPAVNVLFLLVGALLANLLGTTGASMLLIRPWLRMNKYRLTAHHIVFFIFIVSNVGGCLTPVGDPPLFLGYLKGVPFWWVAKACWPMWLTGVGLLLGIFFAVDAINFRRAPADVRRRETAREEWKFQGLGNLLFLGLILGAVFIKHPPFLREFIMIAASVGSYFSTRQPVHEANDFNFHPVKEVAILFAGIFATMLPALDWLQVHAAQLAQPTAGLFYWSSGVLSSVLDNAPTYLSFLSAEIGLALSPDAAVAILAHLKAHGLDVHAAVGGKYAGQIDQAIVALQVHFPGQPVAGLTREKIEMAHVLSDPLLVKCLKAISIGSVFFGANTYIGNGPNFMVKAIADHQKANTPSFLGYIFKFTLPYLLPVLVIVWWLFFRV